MEKTDYTRLNQALVDLLALDVPPIAITFVDTAPTDIARPAESMPPPTADGRTGTVAASCVFWVLATRQTFATIAADHGNCSVGSLTHGFKTLAEAAEGADVAGLVEANWVAPEVFPKIAAVTRKPGAIIYGPLSRTAVDPDVVFLRLDAKQMMKVHAAYPEVRFEGKPQCHIIAIAKEHGALAASTGCALSRERTGMSDSEMTFAVPGHRLTELVERLKSVHAADLLVMGFAREDAARFRAIA
ncbi:MAG TPA: DUF169 domain-containing protein [Stellaceae bacterium]|nr:DUF169 domain-containing protein [Stellaceae bacterium]